MQKKIRGETRKDAEFAPSLKFHARVFESAMRANRDFEPAGTRINFPATNAIKHGAVTAMINQQAIPPVVIPANDTRKNKYPEKQNCGKRNQINREHVGEIKG